MSSIPLEVKILVKTCQDQRFIRDDADRLGLNNLHIRLLPMEETDTLDIPRLCHCRWKDHFPPEIGCPLPCLFVRERKGPGLQRKYTCSPLCPQPKGAGSISAGSFGLLRKELVGALGVARALPSPGR